MPVGRRVVSPHCNAPAWYRPRIIDRAPPGSASRPPALGAAAANSGRRGPFKREIPRRLHVIAAHLLRIAFDDAADAEQANRRHQDSQHLFQIDRPDQLQHDAQRRWHESDTLQAAAEAAWFRAGLGCRDDKVGGGRPMPNDAGCRASAVRHKPAWQSRAHGRVDFDRRGRIIVPDVARPKGGSRTELPRPSAPPQRPFFVTPEHSSYGTLLWRGLRLRCQACGEGMLFRGLPSACGARVRLVRAEVRARARLFPGLGLYQLRADGLLATIVYVGLLAADVASPQTLLWAIAVFAWCFRSGSFAMRSLWLPGPYWDPTRR